MSIENKELLSVAEASNELGVSRWRINQFITQKRLPAARIGRSWVVKKSDLELVKERKAGRPKKEKD